MQEAAEKAREGDENIAVVGTGEEAEKSVQEAEVNTTE